MDVRELSPGDFESEPVARAWATRPLARARSCWPGQIHAGWPGIGTLGVTLSTLAQVDHESSAGLGACESFALWRRGRPGRLDFDPRLAVAIAGVVMEAADAMPLARPLSPGERGVLAAVIASTLDTARAPLQVALETPDALPLRLDIHARLDVLFTTTSGRQFGGWARLLAPASWLESAGAYCYGLDRVPFPVALELAHTTLPAGALASLNPGDAVVFEGYPAVRFDAEVEAALSLGVFRAPGRLRDGNFVMTGRFEAIADGGHHAALAVASPPPTWKGTGSMSSTMEMSPPGVVAATPVESLSGSLAQALTNTPLEVVAELGRVVLTGAELAGLEAGQVLALGTASRGQVTLSVAGRPVGRGVLVNVDGAFGVRLTERI